MAGRTRRTFLRLAAGGVAALPWLRAPYVGADPPAETRAVTVLKRPILCNAPQFVAEELLRAEGFDNVSYQPVEFERVEETLSAGAGDFSMVYAPSAVARIAAGDAIVLLAGVHVG